MSNNNLVMPRREGEDGPIPPRGSRTFEKPDGWYFMTRERVDVGPFASQDLAEKGVQDYVGFSMDADKVYLDCVDGVPDESGLSAAPDMENLAVPPEKPAADVFDRRRGEDAPAPRRQSRIFENDEGFWFATREGSSIGPFPTCADAERGIQDFVSFALDVDHVVSLLEADMARNLDAGEPEDPAAI